MGRKKYLKSYYINNFHEKYTPDPNSGCFLWTGPQQGVYGSVNFNYKKIYAHRFSYELFKGPIPKDMYVLHKCDTPLCVNPDHFFLGTYKDNAQDKYSKGRQKIERGDRAPHRKLNEVKVLEIKRLYFKEKKPVEYLSKRFNTCKSNIWSIVKFQTWHHIGEQYHGPNGASS